MFNIFRKNKCNFIIPFSGELIKIEDVNDEVFSGKMMGDGFAIRLNSDVIVSPVDGVVQSVFPTGHAYGIIGNKGEEILLHIGIDTVNLNGEGFEVLVEAGAKVKKGDVLGKVDINYLKSKNVDYTSMIVFTGGATFKVNKEYGSNVLCREENIIYIE